MCVCVCVRARVRACVRVRTRARARARVSLHCRTGMIYFRGCLQLMRRLQGICDYVPGWFLVPKA